VTRPEAGAGTTFNPLIAEPFAGVAIAGVPTNPSGTPPPLAPKKGPVPAGRIASTKLVSKGARLPVRITCPAGSDCAGTIQLRTRANVKVGRGAARRVNLTRALRYDVAQGRSRTITVPLSSDARTLLKRRSTYTVTLTLKPATGKAVTRNLTLRRG
jgi:hypothetical protein